MVLCSKLFQWLILRQGTNNLAVSSNIAYVVLIARVIVPSNN